MNLSIPEIRIATRESKLALWQAELVATRLRECYPQLTVRLVPMTTRGDQLLDAPLAKIGGKGLFIKELEQALARGEADIAVHSMKDVGVHLPEGYTIAAILPRENPYDAFVSNRFARFTDLPAGAVVGTCSLRRRPSWCMSLLTAARTTASPMAAGATTIGSPRGRKPNQASRTENSAACSWRAAQKGREAAGFTAFLCVRPAQSRLLPFISGVGRAPAASSFHD